MSSVNVLCASGCVTKTTATAIRAGKLLYCLVLYRVHLAEIQGLERLMKRTVNRSWIRDSAYCQYKTWAHLIKTIFIAASKSNSPSLCLQRTKDPPLQKR